MMELYITYNPLTHEQIDVVLFSKWNAPRNALKITPIPKKKGFAIIVNSDFTDLEYIVDHRQKMIYSTVNNEESKKVVELGEIEAEWVLDKPSSRFDEWINGAWIKNEQREFESEINVVDNKRRSLYFSMSDPLVSEANIERIEGNEVAALALEKQAIALCKKIRAENPWPIAPGV